MKRCVFCNIVSRKTPANIVWENEDTIAIVPINPVVDGHIIVIPKTHVVDALENPYITAVTMQSASSLANRPCNIITSAGKNATQSVFHLHIHIVPRSPGDGIKLPWSK